MSNPRIEEVSDSDPEIDDPSTFLPADSEHALQPASQPITSSSSSSQPRQPINPTLLRSAPPMHSTQHQHPHPQPTRDRKELKTHCTIYPIYFDSTRTRHQGRHVHKSLSIPNPLAFNILTAIRSILTTSGHHLPLTLEPDKLHPKDWANPGRVRLQLFTPTSEGHRPLHPTIKSKAHLYRLIGEYLVAHPTTASDPLQFKIPGLPTPENFGKEEIKAPRGWKMGGVLPIHSAAVSGGGVSDNFFKEAMEEMRLAQQAGGGGGGGGMPGLPGAGGGMPDMAALQSMMGGMGGMGGMMGGGGGGAAGGGDGGGKKKGKKKG